MSSSSVCSIGVHGASGRMGRALITAIATDHDCVLSAAVTRTGSDLLGLDAGRLAGVDELGVVLTDEVTDNPKSAFDVLIDFSLPAPSVLAVKACESLGRPVVIGTTGYSPDELAQIHAAAHRIPVLLAPNMSVGVNLAFRLIEMAAKVLADEVDIEVIEAHHRNKVDAPSGTAMRIGEILAEAKGHSLQDVALFGREGNTGVRDQNTIGFSTVRAGDIVGEHTVLFAGDGERLEITHRASSRMNFALGGVRAAKWLRDQRPGLYTMSDVLGMS